MKALPSKPKQFVSPIGEKVDRISICDGQIILCDVQGVAELLQLTAEKVVQLGKKLNRLSVFNDRLFMSADDFSFFVEEIPQDLVPLPAKELAKAIHKTSETQMLYHFWFNQI